MNSKRTNAVAAAAVSSTLQNSSKCGTPKNVRKSSSLNQSNAPVKKTRFGELREGELFHKFYKQELEQKERNIDFPKLFTKYGKRSSEAAAASSSGNAGSPVLRQRVDNSALKASSSTSVSSSTGNGAGPDLKMIVDWGEPKAQGVLNVKNRVNNEYLKRSTLKFPSYKIVCGKYVHVLCEVFKTGETNSEPEISVLLEKNPDPRGKNTGLKLTKQEWIKLDCLMDEFLVEHVRAFHGERHTYTGELDRRTGKPVPLKNFHIMNDVYVSTSAAFNSAYLTIDIRRFERLPNGDLKPLLAGLTLASGGFTYLWSELCNKINVGVAFWETVQRGDWAEFALGTISEVDEDQDSEEENNQVVVQPTEDEEEDSQMIDDSEDDDDENHKKADSTSSGGVLAIDEDSRAKFDDDDDEDLLMACSQRPFVERFPFEEI